MNMGCGSCHNFEKEVLKSYCNSTSMPEDVEVISLTQTEDVSQEDLEDRAEGNMHTKSGLIEEVKNSKLTIREAEIETLEFINKHIKAKNKPPGALSRST